MAELTTFPFTESEGVRYIEEVDLVLAQEVNTRKRKIDM